MIARKKNGQTTPAGDKPVVFDTREFETEFVADTFMPLTAEERARWRRIRTKGEKTGSASVQIDKALMKKLGVLAKRIGIAPEALVARGIKAVLAQSRKG